MLKQIFFNWEKYEKNDLINNQEALDKTFLEIDNAYKNGYKRVILFSKNPSGKSLLSLYYAHKSSKLVEWLNCERSNTLFNLYYKLNLVSSSDDDLSAASIERKCKEELEKFDPDKHLFIFDNVTKDIIQNHISPLFQDTKLRVLITTSDDVTDIDTSVNVIAIDQKFFYSNPQLELSNQVEQMGLLKWLIAFRTEYIPRKWLDEIEALNKHVTMVDDICLPSANLDFQFISGQIPLNIDVSLEYLEQNHLVELITIDNMPYVKLNMSSRLRDKFVGDENFQLIQTRLIYLSNKLVPDFFGKQFPPLNRFEETSLVALWVNLIENDDIMTSITNNPILQLAVSYLYLKLSSCQYLDWTLRLKFLDICLDKIRKIYAQFSSNGLQELADVLALHARFYSTVYLDRNNLQAEIRMAFKCFNESFNIRLLNVFMHKFSTGLGKSYCDLAAFYARFICPVDSSQLEQVKKLLLNAQIVSLSENVEEQINVLLRRSLLVDEPEIGLKMVEQALKLAEQIEKKDSYAILIFIYLVEVI